MVLSIFALLLTIVQGIPVTVEFGREVSVRLPSASMQWVYCFKLRPAAEAQSYTVQAVRGETINKRFEPVPLFDRTMTYMFTPMRYEDGMVGWEMTTIDNPDDLLLCDEHIS